MDDFTPSYRYAENGVRYYVPADLDYLIANYATMPTVELAKRMDREIKSIHWKARSLGLTKPARDTPVVPELDLAYYGGLLDGEGHFGVHKGIRKSDGGANYFSRISLRMSDEAAVVAYGQTFDIPVKPYLYKNPLSKLPIFAADMSGRKTIPVLRVLVPVSPNQTPTGHTNSGTRNFEACPRTA